MATDVSWALKPRIYVENQRARDPAYHVTEDALHRALGDIEGASITIRFDDERDEEALRQASVFIAGRLDKALLSSQDQLRLIQCTSAGVESYMPLDWMPPQAVLTNASGVHAPKVGEYGLLVTLMLHERIPAYATLQRNHVWQRNLRPTISGSRVLIYGVGALGGAVAEKLRLLGVAIDGVRRSGEPHPCVDRMVTPDRVAELLPEADILIITCPLTEQTRGAIGAAELALLKQGAGVANLARGAVMDYDALAAELRSGRLSGAVLDVFPQEPLPPEAPWWDVPNLVVVPHVSADDPFSYIDRCLEILADNLRRATKGEPLRNVVDGERGY
ncbi:D-2-hydroxyacid dehydrogenase [Telmatospirillum sp. J64-1]|uniref:D-2-hydroxyacid dehydrogenase n=1 Tax=Telmatospirillum sp. J64-1 TaxID=2502183 RepID=UPI00115C8A31|nr:D-2-hydroxyacid dehydrogenase [Telmatospirillum sp. J64-1]